MAADLNDLKRLYRRLARNKAADPKGLTEQIAWLNETFVRHAESTDADSERLAGSSFEGQSSTFSFPDSTPQERAVALDQLLTEMEAEAAGEVVGNAPAWLTPHFCNIPR